MFHVVDNFLETYPKLRQYADTAVFEDEKNPVDNVVYPFICKEIPEDVRQEVIHKISRFLNRIPICPTIFMRMSPEGSKPTHTYHTDKMLGDYSLMLYMCDGVGGTAMLRHKESGICYNPENDFYVEQVNVDMNNPDAWDTVSRVPMKQNRAAIFDAGFFHAAMPVGGFGYEPKDARMVLTVFFS